MHLKISYGQANIKLRLCVISAGKYNEQIQIDDNATGYSYEKVFGRFIDESLTEVEVQDPYIRSVHQVGARACVFVCVHLIIHIRISFNVAAYN